MKNAFKKQDKYSGILKRIFVLFREDSERYGYRRIYVLLSREGTIVSEKIVCRIIAEDGLAVRVKSKRKYNFYQGKISPSCQMWKTGTFMRESRMKNDLTISRGSPFCREVFF